ncbi:MAG: DUF1805 domain-containing protein [Polyangiaceae bacterium]
MTSSNELADTLHATLRAKPGCEAILETRLAELLAKTREEKAVRVYMVHRSVDAHTDFLVYERYVDPDGLQTHLASEYLRQIFADCEPLLDFPPHITRSRALFGLPYQRVNIDGSAVDAYVITIGPVALTFARATHGLVTCGAILPGALDGFGVAAARVRPSAGAIGSLDELLTAKVVERNTHASAFGVALNMSGREALLLLSREAPPLETKV